MSPAIGWSSVTEDQFAQDVRIVLAAADFSKEMTTAVLWLNDHNLDIRCVRLKPYKMEGGTLLLDVQQIIPLPETASFQTQIGLKNQAERQSRSNRSESRIKFWTGLLAHAKTLSPVHANCSPTEGGWIAGSAGRQGFGFTYTIRQFDSQVEVWIDHGSGQVAKNKLAFKALESQKAAIEAAFGGPLEWQPLEGGVGCRVRFVMDGGYKSPVETWPTIQANLTDAMIRLDKATRQRISTLTY